MVICHSLTIGWPYRSQNFTHSYVYFHHRTYKLGEAILTPFGRHQLCEYNNKVGSYSVTEVKLVDLGISMRMKYGFLLKVILNYIQHFSYSP